MKQTNINKKSSEIYRMLDIYDVMTPLVLSKEHPTLKVLGYSWQSTCAQIRKHLLNDLTTKELGHVQYGIRQGLYETPKVINSILGEKEGNLLIHEIEKATGLASLARTK